jgi:hypothetical protein
VGAFASITSRTRENGLFLQKVFRNRNGSRVSAVDEHDAEARVAARAEARGDALTAMVRWGLAAYEASDSERRITALAKARAAAELAFHQELYLANASKSMRFTWRQLTSLTGICWETLYRRYHTRPAKLPPGRPGRLG